MRAWKVVLVAAVAVSAGAAGWFGWNEQQYRQEIQALTPQVRLVGLHLGAVAAKRSGAGVTFAEYFGHIEQAIAALDQAALQIGAQAPRRARAAASGAVQYGANAQEILRAVLACSRVAMNTAAAIKRADEALEEAKASDNSYTVNAALDRAKRANNDTREEIEAGAKIAAAFPPKVELMARQMAWVGRTFGADVPVPKATVEALVAALKDCS